MSQSDPDSSPLDYSRSSLKEMDGESKQVNSNDVEIQEQTDNETKIDNKFGFSFSSPYINHTTSPQNRLASPEDCPVSPEYCPSPCYCPTSPQYRLASPQYRLASPEYRPASPKYCSSPNWYCPRSPEYHPLSSPDYGNGNADMEAEYKKNEYYYRYYGKYRGSPCIGCGLAHPPSYNCLAASSSYSPPNDMEAENKTRNDQTGDESSHVESYEGRLIIDVPSPKVSLVIGAMATLRFLQHDLCGRIRVLKDSEVYLKSAIRLVELTGTVAQIEFSKKLIDSVLEEENHVESMEVETKKPSIF